ncbi:MAG: hypothetical protein E6J62_02400 [Deltaproteobacteria bacterium]|nr:MAG: hypothetical protein E6J62_02400 [Deltaproteobacteria bacterium]
MALSLRRESAFAPAATPGYAKSLASPAGARPANASIMLNTKAAVAAICTISAAAAAQEDEPPPLPATIPAQTVTPFFHVVGSGLFGLDARTRDRPGFAFDGLVGMVFAQRPTQFASFFGVGMGGVFVNRTVHPAARMTAGIEAFHYGPLSPQLGIDVIVSWCDNATDRDCGATQTRTYIAGRLGVRM